MKKIILSIALVAVAASSAMAQISVGAGYLSATTTTKIADASTSGVSGGFYAGADAAYNLGLGFAIAPGLYYGYLSSNEDLYGVANSSTKSHYLSIPVNVQYSLPLLDELDVFAYAGPKFNIGLASKTTASVLDVSTEIDNYGENSNLQRFDLALGVGLGVDIFDIVRVKFGYNWGLLDLNKSENITTNNSYWHVGAAFLF